jgi:hypothetical protein
MRVFDRILQNRTSDGAVVLNPDIEFIRWTPAI